MLLPLAAVFGGSGTLYVLLRYFWRDFYYDYYYEKQNAKIGTAVGTAVQRNAFLVDIFEEKVKLHPKKTFIIYDDRRFSYEEVDKLANKVARAALAIGIKPGDVAAVLLHNEPTFVWNFIGLMKAGIQAAFMNFNLRGKSLAHCVTSSGSKHLIVSSADGLIDAAREIVPELGATMVVQYGHVTDRKQGGFPSLEEVMSRMSDEPFPRSVRAPAVNGLTPCMFIFTSGTTGLPKPAIVTHFKTIGAGNSFNAFDMSADDIVYNALPLYHSSGLMVGFGNVVTKGATLVVRDKFSARHFWDDCRKYDVTIFLYIGEICRYLVARPKDKLDGVHKVKYAFGNGLRQDIWAEFKDRFKIPNIMEFYGATEAPVGFINLFNRFGSCGRTSPSMRKKTPAAVVKFDFEAQAPLRNRHGRCVPVDFDEVGLLIIPLVIGVTSFQGYHGRKDATQKKMLYDVFEEGDSCFNTGDLLKLDRDYFMYFSDRVGDTFRWKGENVSTTEVSNILTDVEFILDANVYGVHVRGADGRAGMASLRLNDPRHQTLTPVMLEAISKHVRKSLPSYAMPRFLRLQQEFAMTSTFKQQKTTLVHEGFDLKKVSDPLYYLNPSTQSYQPLDQLMHVQIMAGKIPI